MKQKAHRDYWVELAIMVHFFLTSERHRLRAEIMAFSLDKLREIGTGSFISVVVTGKLKRELSCEAVVLALGGLATCRF